MTVVIYVGRGRGPERESRDCVVGWVGLARHMDVSIYIRPSNTTTSVLVARPRVRLLRFEGLTRSPLATLGRFGVRGVAFAVHAMYYVPACAPIRPKRNATGSFPKI